ncbi:MAG: hypothetical protein ACI4KF_12605 [Huintestinicola sp.]
MDGASDGKRHIRPTEAVLAVLAVLLTVFVATDTVRTKLYGTDPLFCVKAVEYSDGVSADFYGLGYKIWRDYDPFEDSTEYYISLWILPKTINI